MEEGRERRGVFVLRMRELKMFMQCFVCSAMELPAAKVETESDESWHAKSLIENS